MSNFFGGDEKKEKTGTMDDYWQDVEKYPGLQKLVEGKEFAVKYPDFANKLGEALSKLNEKGAKEKRDKNNSIEIDGYSYYWTMWNGERQINRFKPQGGGGGSSKPMNAIIHQPIQIAFATKEDANSTLTQYATGANTYSRIVEVTKDQDNKIIIIIEQFKLVKVPYESIPA